MFFHIVCRIAKRHSTFTFPTSKMSLQQILSALLNQDKVRIRDPSEVEKKLVTLTEKGPGSLQVITDFDATLTKYHVEGKRCDSSYGIVANSSLVSEDFKKKSNELFQKYNRIETDPKMTIEDKIPLMVEWYEKSHELMIANEPRFTKEEITEMVKLSVRPLRDNAKLVIHRLNSAGVPVLVFSAGIGDVVHDVLQHENVALENVHVISNFINFGEDGRLIGMKDPLIHMFNKNEAAVHNDHSQYFDDLQSRNNVILMGDSLGDANMDDGVTSPKTVLRVGFLNHDFDKHLESYMAAFDVVLIDDQSLDFVNAIIEKLILRTE